MDLGALRARLRELAGRVREHKAAAQLGAVLRWLAEPAAAVLIVFVATTAIAEPFYVPSGSMEPTLAIGDGLLASKYPYGYSHYSVRWGLAPNFSGRILSRLPTRGDVVVFYPVNSPRVAWVKRVIGLPGDRVQMIAGHLYINGEELELRADGSAKVENHDGAYIEVPRYVETLPGGRTHPIFKWQWDGQLDNTEVLTVPEGQLFMMGDNRDDSWDSRVPLTQGGIGFVPLDRIVGRADVVLGSYDFLNASRDGWFGAFRFSRLFGAVR